MRPTLLAVLAGVMLCALSGWLLWDQKVRSEQWVEASVLNTATQLGQTLQTTLDDTDLLLQSVAQRYAHTQHQGPQAVQVLLDELRDEIPQHKLIARIGITNAHGLVLHNTAYTAQTRPANISDRAHFQLARGGQGGMVISEPVRAHLHGEWALILSRGLRQPDGAFAGVVYAVYPIESIRALFKHVDLGAQGVLALRNARGAPIAQWPTPQAADEGPVNTLLPPTLGEQIQKLPAGGHLVDRTATAADGVQRIQVHYKLPNSPFWVSAGRPTHEVMDLGHRPAWALMVASLAMAVWMVLSARQFERNQRGLQNQVRGQDQALAEQSHFLK